MTAYSTTPTLALRPYQRECLDAVYSSYDTTQRAAVVLPTGAGKTVIFSHLTREHLESRGSRVLILVHRDELADQALNKIQQISPELAVGKVKAKDNQIAAQVIVASVQTLARERRMTQLLDAQSFAGPIGLVIVDECHHAAAVSYRNIMGSLGCFSGIKTGGETHAVGFTATLARGDGIGLGSVWENVVYLRSVLNMIAEGYLCDVRGKAVTLDGLDLGSVKRSGGDYQAKDLGDAFIDANGPDLVALAMKRHAAGRRSLVFTPTVGAAEAVQDALALHGFKPGVVTGATPRDARLLAYDRFRTGRLDTLVSCMVLTEGFDAPWADCAVIARPTRSAPLYIQMVGRVLRTWPGKSEALVLDVSGSDAGISTLVDLAPGQIKEVAESESLAEAAIREEETAGHVIPSKYGTVAFELKHRDMDLFKGSSHAWLRTYGGAMFLAAGNAGQIVLWPDKGAGTWTVAYAPGSPGLKWERLHTGLALSMAQAWAESEVESRTGHLAYGVERDARWRANKASDGQVRNARSMGLAVPAEARRGEVADLISVHQASRTIDRFLVNVG